MRGRHRLIDALYTSVGRSKYRSRQISLMWCLFLQPYSGSACQDPLCGESALQRHSHVRVLRVTFENPCVSLLWRIFEQHMASSPTCALLVNYCTYTCSTSPCSMTGRMNSFALCCCEHSSSVLALKHRRQAEKVFGGTFAGMLEAICTCNHVT